MHVLCATFEHDKQVNNDYTLIYCRPERKATKTTFTACCGLALYPGSNYAGEEKRAWYLPFAVAPTIRGVCLDIL